MKNAGSRKQYIDVAQGLVIVLMVIAHSGPPKFLHRFIHGFHMPFFFILSGLLFDHEKWTSVRFSDFLKIKAKSYVLPYFMLGIVNWILNLLLILTTHKSNILSRLSIGLLEIGYAGKFIRLEIATALWFLACIFLSNIVLYLLCRIKVNWFRHITAMLTYAAAVLLGKLPPFFTYGIPWHADVALAGTFFMYLGMQLRSYERLFEKPSVISAIAAFAGACCLLLNAPEPDLNLGNYGNPFLLAVVSLLMFYAILILSHRLSRYYAAKVISYLGRHTILFIGISGFFHFSLAIVWKRLPLIGSFPEPWYAQAVIVILCVTLYSFLWDRLKRRFQKIAFF